MKNYIFTSESITEGHPDKICDRIADSILDEALRQDPASKMAVEATIKDDFVLIYGEANTKAKLEYEEIAKEVIREIGYTEEYEVLVKVREQSSEINHAVVQDDGEIGAGDQGIMFGYACDDTDNYMPAAIEYAHKLAKRLSDVRRGNALLLPDGKTQVSVEYENDKIKRIDTIVVSTQHVAEASQQQIADIVMKDVITPVIPDELLDEDTIYLINPSGSFVMGGSFGDSGTTGEKSLWTAMAVWEESAVAASPVKIHPRLTAVQHITAVMSQRILWHISWQVNVRYRLHMLSVR